ncbi:unnamed protein product, partial [Meganyctiphanes norvegica]
MTRPGFLKILMIGILHRLVSDIQRDNLKYIKVNKAPQNAHSITLRKKHYVKLRETFSGQSRKDSVNLINISKNCTTFKKCCCLGRVRPGPQGVANCENCKFWTESGCGWEECFCHTSLDISQSRGSSYWCCKGEGVNGSVNYGCFNSLWCKSLDLRRQRGAAVAALADENGVPGCMFMPKNFSGERFFLGGSDAAEEGWWKWLAGGSPISTDPTEFPWFNGYPPDNCCGGQHCLTVNYLEGYDDERCFHSYRYICKKEMCPGGVMIGSQCLWFNEEKLTWYAAKAACKYRGQTLASLDDPPAVIDYVAENYGRDYIWIGGSDSGKEGTWLWTDGRHIPINHPPWAPNNPGDGSVEEDCLCVEYRGYHDYICSLKFAYICEQVKKKN